MAAVGGRLSFDLAMEHSRQGKIGRPLGRSVREVSGETFVCKVHGVYTTFGGKGMPLVIHFHALSALVGDAFASSTAKQILAAIGDRLTFGLAMEYARANHPRLKAVGVLNADDVSICPRQGKIGRPLG